MQKIHLLYPGPPSPATKLSGPFALTLQQRAVPAHQPVAGVMWPHKTPSRSILLSEILLNHLPADKA